MIPRPVWEAAYERGIVAVGAGDWDEALKAFDEMYKLSGRLERILRSRSEVLDLLADVEVACVGAVRSADLASGIAQRSETQLFGMLRCLPTLVQNSILLPGRRATPPAQISVLEHAEALQSSLLARRNLIDYLPPEILALIGRAAVDITGSLGVAFNLAAVCRQWRSIFVADSLLWGHVCLRSQTEASAIAKFHACVLKGPVSHLELDLHYRVSPPGGLLLAAMRGQVRRLQSLVVRSPAIRLYKIFNLVKKCSDLKKLVVYWRPHATHLGTYNRSLNSQPLLSIRRFEVHVCGNLPHRHGARVSLVWLLRVLPNLEELVIDHPEYTLYPLPVEPIQVPVPHLSRLVVCEGDHPVPVNTRPPIFHLPSLRVLDVAGSTTASYGPYLFPTAHPPNTEHLTHLLLRGSIIDGPTLIGHLPDLPALTHLDIRGKEAPHQIVRALVHPPTEGASGSRLCPRLEHLELNVQHVLDRIENGITVRIDITALSTSLSEEVRRMVASRPASALEVVGWNGDRVGFCWNHASAIARSYMI